MAASLEYLPTELLDSIIVDLTFADLVGLWKCSRQLSYRLGDALFGSSNALQTTMRWACSNGDADLIRAAISHGANPSRVHIDKQPPRIRRTPPRAQPTWLATRKAIDTEPGPYKASTLAITARKGHVEAFAALLSRGATLEGVSCQHQRKALARALIKPRGQLMMQCLMDVGVRLDVMDDWTLKISLVGSIKRNAPVELVRKMLSGGANPNHLAFDTPGDLASPLSAAIERGSAPIFDVLVEHGADIHGSVKCPGFFAHPDKLFVSRRPRCIPIFAAAERMGKTGSIEMMDRCLRSGADINSLAPASFGHEFIISYFATTPLLTYVEAIQTWPAENGLLPSSGISYLLSHGAQIQRIEHQEGEIWPWLHGPRSGISTRIVPALSTIEILLYKWGLSKLHEPQFFGLIKYLVRLGDGRGREREILGTFSQDWKPRWTPWVWSHLRLDQDHPDCVPKWWDIVDLLIDRLQSEHNSPCDWLVHTIKMNDKTKLLIGRGIATQEAKDTVLSTSL